VWHSPSATHTVPARERPASLVQRQARTSDTDRVNHDAAPVVAAEVLLRHGLTDDAIAEWLARTWEIDDHDCHAAVRAAHILLQRAHPHATAE